MSTPSVRLLVSVSERIVLLKIEGRANFDSSVNFKTLLSELRQKNYDRYLLDLTDCLLMDSTFVGVLAGFGLKLASPDATKAGSAIELLNPNSRISELLENLGVAHLFKIVRGDPLPLENMESLPQTTTTPTRQEVSRTCLAAHQTLMEINPANIPKFKDVAQFLVEDLKKLKSR
ncbi:MAG: STAS domain-containing protein [Verrucomicrobia bacterium]|nr:STAS domain-containing protein [Verrucomicrobiota bacterium]